MKYICLAVVVLILSSLMACNGTPAAPSANSPAPQSSPTPATSPTAPLTGFEKDLQYIRNGGYTYVWVFSRKDKKPLDKDDGAFLRTNAPQVVDWVTTDEGRKVIAGTNFNLEEGNLAAIKKRFVTEDYSAR
ncbi:MAG TPA: hypothetical protein VN844_27920 [Pyrinomonadaceae bacterium]|nr:hypothetical protein [Pyrinomonadaceae bacterium]